MISRPGTGNPSVKSKTFRPEKSSSPLVLVSSRIEARAGECRDYSISLSLRYDCALTNTAAIPWIVPATTDEALIAEAVRRADGLMLTGGEDVNPELYGPPLPAGIREKVRLTPDGGGRDLRECLLVREALRQRKPILAICRGHQLLNVALGGTLIADIPAAKAGAANHSRSDRGSEIVHEIGVRQGTLLAGITGKLRLGVNSTHHQAVARVAPGLRVAAVSDDGIIEAMEGEWCGAPGGNALSANPSGLPFLVSVQFHPERLEDRYPEHRALFRAFAAACARRERY